MGKYLSFVALLILALVSCQKVVDADGLLDADPQVFIVSYLSPQDTVFSVHISRALAVFGTTLDGGGEDPKFQIKDATVTISDDAGNSTDLSYSEEDRAYLANASTLDILANDSYFLRVIADGKEFNASCRIPEKVAAIEESIEIKEAEFGGQEAEINLSFQDFEGQRDFYILGGLVTTTIQFEEQEPQTIDFSLFFDSGEFLTDNLEDGGTLNGTSRTYIDSSTEFDATTITLQVANVEEILFQNLRTASTNSDAEGNPFVEYSIAPDNFNENGAVGVFAGYQLTEKVVTLGSEENP